MFTKNARKMLLALLCASLSGALAGGVEAVSSEVVEVATTCEIQRSFDTDSPDEHVIETGKCGWLARKKNSDRLLVRFDDPHASRPSEQRDQNGFGGPLCC